jgi:6-phosphogluconolactonase
MRPMSMLRRPRGWFVLLLGLLLTFAITASASANSHWHHHKRHHRLLFTATNNPSGNQVIVFTQHSDGSVTQRETVSTGGTGAPNPPFGFPIVDTQGSINVAENGHLVFVVNSGDNSISSFRSGHHGLTLVSHVSSGGVLPTSLTSRDHVLYAVNGRSSNIYGFRFNDDGHLYPLGGQAPSGRPLSTAFPTTVAAQISFTPDGDQLVVTERGLPSHTGVIDTFDVGKHDLAGPAHKNTGVGFIEANPFGFDFDNKGHLLASNAGYINAPGDDGPPFGVIGDPTQFVGSATAYDVKKSGALSRIGDVLSGGRAACWLVVGKDSKYAYVTNTLSDSVADIFTGIGGVTVYRVGHNGSLTYQSQANTSGAATAGTPGSPSDMAFSEDGKYLYVNVPTILGPDNSFVDTFRIGNDGNLTMVSSLAGLPATDSGLAASN